MGEAALSLTSKPPLRRPLFEAQPGLTFTGLSCDSRRITTGDLFVALPGTQTDGRKFIEDAVTNGAAAVLGPPGTRVPKTCRAVPVIETENPRRRYAKLAARFFASQPETVVAITGTNGKTSTASFLRQIWTHAGLTAGAMGTLGVQSPVYSTDKGLTTPDAVDLHATLADLATGGVDYLALEASSHGLDQDRLDGVSIAAAGFTNLSRDHLDYHGTLEAYFEAKARLFDDLLADGGTAVINADDPHGQKVLERLSDRSVGLVTFGEQGDAVRLIERTLHPHGQTLRLDVMGAPATVTLPLVGRFQVENVLCALGLALATGIDRAVALEALETLTGARGRMEIVATTQAGATVFVDYAHTPDALNNVLTALRPHTQNRLHVIFGCGGDRDPGKRPEMARACATHADVVILTDDNPRSEDPATIRAQAKVGAPDALEIGDRRRAIQAAINGLEAGDVLVISGKGHEQGQIFGDLVLPFDDATVAREIIAHQETNGNDGSEGAA